MYYWKDIFLQLPPGEESVYPDVGGDDDEQREEEDLAVVGRVVDVRPVVWAENLNCQFLLLLLFIVHVVRFGQTWTFMLQKQWSELCSHQ